MKIIFNCFILSRKSINICTIYRYKHKGKLYEILSTMPKPQGNRIAAAQKQRQNIKQLGEKYAPGTVYLQVIGCGAQGAPKALYLFTDQKRYLFNCGEGTQRLAHEHKVKLSRLEHIFITSKNWSSIGGLPGVSLTLQDVGVPEITLHGPNGLEELYNSTRRFIVLKDMKISIADCDPLKDFEDNVMSVKYIPLGPDNPLLFEDNEKHGRKSKISKVEIPGVELEQYETDNTDYYSRERKDTNKKPMSKTKATEPSKLSNKVLSELKKKNVVSVCYVCKLKDRLGKLDLEKCAALGVKPGPHLGMLKRGQNITLTNGTKVLASSVKTPDEPGALFMILDVQDVSHINDVDFEMHYSDNKKNENDNVPSLIVHFTNKEIFNDPKYQLFVRKFGRKPRHIVLNTENTCLGSTAVHRMQYKLHMLDENIFPLLKDKSIPRQFKSDSSESLPSQDDIDELKMKVGVANFHSILSSDSPTDNVILAGSSSTDVEDDFKYDLTRTLTVYHLRPDKGLDRSQELTLNIEEYLSETIKVEGFVRSLKELRSSMCSVREQCGPVTAYPKIIFLGTGSCIPNKTRNTSGMVLHIDENHTMILDCGEGTYGQMYRFYGPNNINKVMQTLKAIYVSHLHADHHIGLLNLLQERRRAILASDDEYSPVYLLAPGQIISWLSVYDQQFEPIREDFQLVPNLALMPSTQHATITPAILANIGIADLKTCLVSHCPNAFGVAIETKGGEKITYSGDTIPCDALVEIGDKSTLLIHEATMEDELAQEARVKMHSTISQAMLIGNQMSAEHVILTHFSQRYARLPRVNLDKMMEDRNVGIAFDNMQVRMSDLKLLHLLYKPLHLMFFDHLTELEMKALKRNRQLENTPSENTSNVSSTERIKQMLLGENISREVEDVTESVEHIEAKKAKCDDKCGHNINGLPVSRIPVRITTTVTSKLLNRESNTQRMQQRSLEQAKPAMPKSSELKTSLSKKGRKPKNELKLSVNKAKSTINPSIDIAKVKEKFRSKHHWLDSKFDRIEGLNWISWKV